MHAHGDVANAVHESSHVRRAKSARSYEGIEAFGGAECSTEEAAALVEHDYSMTWSARPSTDGRIVRPSAQCGTSKAVISHRLATRYSVLMASTI